MRSKKEIREEINRLLILEKEAAEDIEEAINEDYGYSYLDIHIERANIYQRQRAVLEWVLNENNNIKEFRWEDFNMISRLCYELYKVDWKHSHMITVEREMDSIKNYYEDLVDDDTEYTYNDYLKEFGYDGELYVCYEEFLDAEYMDEDYICSLLDNENLIDMYRKDIKE